jgi:Icc-related predicted phosphoesterase
MKMKVILTGDIHNEFGKLNELINKKRPDLVICCGDFGYWPKVKWGAPLSNIRPQGAKILWCDGNHEDHWSLKERDKDEMVSNVIYMPRGSTYTLDDGRTIMFMGGADSIDKESRWIGVDWFPEEVITQKDLYDLPQVNVDIFVTHTCPAELVNEMLKYNSFKYGDPSPMALSELWRIYKPKLWFFGHWHIYKEMDLFGTKCYALGSCTWAYHKWWTWLPDLKL